MQEITVYNLGNLPTAPINSFHELQEDFKISDPDKNMKLQMLILTRGFKYAFKAWRDPDGKLWIIDAHQRKKALKALIKSGFIVPDIPYEPIHAKTKQEAVEEIAAYNSEFAEKNPDTILFKKYNIGTDMLERFNMGFEPVTLDYDRDRETLMKEEFEIIEDDAPEVRKETFTQTGDIWLLEPHRIMCGDSIEPKDIVALMEGKKAKLMVTDPPYNVAYEGKTKDKLTIQNDSMDNNSFYQFLYHFYCNSYRILEDGAGIYIFHSDNEGANFRKAMVDAQFKLAQCCIWVKQAFIMGRQDYHWQHEPVLYGWKPTGPHYWHGDRKQSTVWNFDRPIRNDLHPTMKPVALMAYPIQNSSREQDLVVDLFLGSGATLMACQQTNRICYGMEKDQRYADVEVRRFHAAFPDIEITLIRNGERIPFEEIKDQLL